MNANTIHAKERGLQAKVTTEIVRCTLTVTNMSGSEVGLKTQTKFSSNIHRSSDKHEGSNQIPVGTKASIQNLETET